MCLAVPGKIVAILDDDPAMRMGKVDFGGVSRSVCLSWVPEAQIGDYVIVHVGFALQMVDPEEAETVFAFLRTMDGALEEEMAAP